MTPSLSDAPELFQLLRGGVPEISIRGIAALQVQNKMFSIGSIDLPLPARSLLKPWQFLATEIPLPDAGGVEWSLCWGSHNGEPKHLEALSALMAQVSDMHSETLRCPPTWPLDAEQASIQ